MDSLFAILKENWFSLIQTFAIVTTLLFTSYALIQRNKSEKLRNLLEITKSNRELLSFWMVHPKLARVFDETHPEKKLEITKQEETYLNMFILHLNTIFYAIKSGALVPIEGLELDVKDFLSLPIPNKVWRNIKEYQNKEFVEFIEMTLRK